METTFIQNVNTLAKNIDVIVEAKELFDENIVPVLEEVAALDLQDVTNDLIKGNFLGNRKIDIDIALNKTGITSTMSYNDAMAIWSNTETTVYYSKAFCYFTDGSTVEVVFVNDDMQPINVSTHGAIVDQLNKHVAFTASLNNTSILEDVGGKTGTMIRIVDTVGSSSSLERIELVAVSGSFIDGRPPYFWAKTTSSLQTLANRAGDIIALGNDIDSIITLSNRIDELLEIRESMGELVQVYNTLSDVSLVADNMNSVTSVSTALPKITTIHTNLALVDTVSANIVDVVSVGDNIAKVVNVSDNVSKISTVEANLTSIATNSSNIVAIQNASANATTATSKANEATSAAATATTKANEATSAAATATSASSTANTKASEASASASASATSASNSNTYSITASTKATEASVSATNAANSAANASTSATSASASATSAANSAAAAGASAITASDAATTATTKANQIQALSVQSSTLVAGSNATASYNSGTGILTLGLPTGAKGEKGDAFTVNASGLAVSRSTYNAQPQGFSFLATDTSTIYFKNSATSGDWSAGAPFGKGDKGDTGAAGSQWRTGSGVPLNTLGVDGDMYLDTATGNAYQRLAGVYTLSSVLSMINDSSSALTYTWSASKLTTQFAGKQPLDSDLTALAGIATTGLLARTGAGTAASRTLSAGSTKLSITNGDGVSGNPTLDVVEGNIAIGNLSGTLGVSKGGTGVTELTGLVKANGLSAFSAATAGTDYVVPSGNITGSSASCTGNAATATKLANARDITLTGDASGTVSFDGSANVSITVAIADDSHAHAFTNLTGKPTTLSGYGITDAATSTHNHDLAEADIPSLSTSKITGLDVALDARLQTTGGTMTGAITAIRETKVAMAANDIDLASGNLFTKTIVGYTTFTISNVLSSGNANSFILELTNGGSAVITWWAGMKWAGGIAPTLTASGVDILGFYSHDGGATWNILGINKDVK